MSLCVSRTLPTRANPTLPTMTRTDQAPAIPTRTHLAPTLVLFGASSPRVER
jgi:hypothetical protein